MPRRKVATDKPPVERDEKGRVKKGKGASQLAKRRTPEPPQSFTEFQRGLVFDQEAFREVWNLLIDRIKKYPEEPAYMKMYLDRVLKSAKDNEITVNIKPLVMQMPDGFTDDDIYAEAPRKHVKNEADKRP